MIDKKRILIVEDEPDMVEWLTTFFEDNGYDASYANNGFDGFEMAEKDHPDLITLDISMDKESGIKMYKKLHQSEKAGDIPVIIITGVSPELEGFIDRQKSLNPPAAFFEKPVDRDELLKKVRDLIG
jgi:DNA-binding response OmpR family regulator